MIFLCKGTKFDLLDSLTRTVRAYLIKINGGPVVEDDREVQSVNTEGQTVPHQHPQLLE